MLLKLWLRLCVAPPKADTLADSVMASSVQIVNVEAEGGVEAIAEVVGGAPEGGNLGSLSHGVLKTQILH